MLRHGWHIASLMTYDNGDFPLRESEITFSRTVIGYFCLTVIHSCCVYSVRIKQHLISQTQHIYFRRLKNITRFDWSKDPSGWTQNKVKIHTCNCNLIARDLELHNFMIPFSAAWLRLFILDKTCSCFVNVSWISTD